MWDEETCHSQEAAAWLKAGNGEFRGKWAAGNFLPSPLDIKVAVQRSGCVQVFFSNPPIWGWGPGRADAGRQSKF